MHLNDKHARVRSPHFRSACTPMHMAVPTIAGKPIDMTWHVFSAYGRLHNTCSGGVEAIASGSPSTPRLVIAVDPRLSETCATTVRLKLPVTFPGGR